MALSVLLCAALFFTLVGCEQSTETPEVSEAITTSGIETVLAGQLLTAKKTATATADLSEYPALDRDMAYKIQLKAFRTESEGSDYLVGWKMGGTRVVDPAVPADPSFAYILRTDSLANAAHVPNANYVDGDLLVEAEIAFIMGQDLQGGNHSMEEVMNAVAEVAGAIELIDIRIVAGDDGVAPHIDHMIAANLSHAGVILTEERRPLNGFDLVGESAVVLVDGEEKASGSGSQIMGTTPMDALFWIANALPEHGLYLRAGDVVITGSLYDNPTIVAGNTAEVRFDSFGIISVSMD